MTTILTRLRAQSTRSRHNRRVDQRLIRGNFGLALPASICEYGRRACSPALRARFTPGRRGRTLVGSKLLGWLFETGRRYAPACWDSACAAVIAVPQTSREHVGGYHARGHLPGPVDGPTGGGNASRSTSTAPTPTRSASSCCGSSTVAPPCSSRIWPQLSPAITRAPMPWHAPITAPSRTGPSCGWWSSLMSSAACCGSAGWIARCRSTRTWTAPSPP